MIVRGIKHPVLLPSPAYKEWTQAVLRNRAAIRSALGSRIPILGPVSIAAIFYRDALTGDAVGYYQALADVLQSNVWTCRKCNRKTVDENPIGCSHCPSELLKQTRHGLGIIEDDKLIEHWDGSRLSKDSARPRIELTVSTIEPPEGGLFG